MAKAENVIVYSTPTCPFCRQVKEYLKEKGVEFTDFNAAADAEARKEMVRKSSQMGVPVIDVDGTIVVGFNRTRLEELLS